MKFTKGQKWWTYRKHRALTPTLATEIARHVRIGTYINFADLSRAYQKIKPATLRALMQGRYWAAYTGGPLTARTNPQKLTYARACAIKKALARGASTRALARENHVSESTIRAVLELRSWKYALPGLNETLLARHKRSKAQWHRSRRKIRGVSPAEAKRIKKNRAARARSARRRAERERELAT